VKEHSVPLFQYFWKSTPGALLIAFLLRFAFTLYRWTLFHIIITFVVVACVAICLGCYAWVERKNINWRGVGSILMLGVLKGILIAGLLLFLSHLGTRIKG